MLSRSSLSPFVVRDGTEPTWSCHPLSFIASSIRARPCRFTSLRLALFKALRARRASRFLLHENHVGSWTASILLPRFLYLGVMESPFAEHVARLELAASTLGRLRSAR